MKRWQKIAGLAVVLVVISFGIIMASSPAKLTVGASDLPVATVNLGDLDMRIRANGELRATHSTMLSAPPIGGGILQITHLVPGGTVVKDGDVVLEFDPSEQQYMVEQSRSELLQAEQEITKAKADAAVQAAQDEVALLKARFEVRRAQLEVGKNELVSNIDAKKNNLALEQAKRALAQLEQDIHSHAASGQASIELALEKSNKARLAMTEARENIEKMKVRSPTNGLLAIEKNLDSIGGMFWGGMSLPDYREGDQVQAGNNIARVIDPSDMEVVAKINERERGNVAAGQAVDVSFDALPGQAFHGKVKTVGSMASKNFWEDDPAGSFEITIQLSALSSELHPGLTTQIVVLGDKKKNVIYLPRQALFLKDGKHVAYVKKDGTFEVQVVKITAESESRAVVEGLKAGSEVALLDPTAPRKSSEPAAGGPGLGGGR